MTLLAQRLRARIAQSGPIGVDAFIAAALGDAEAGYYATRDPFGAEGDFVTAPDISPIFGELIGAWLIAVWQGLGALAPVQVVELGPGRGTLLASVLRVWQALAPSLLAAARLHLVETSPRLRAVQRTALQALGHVPETRWHDHLASVPPGPLLLVANEFFDALPIRQFICRADGWRERRVGLRDPGGFAFVDGPPAEPGVGIAAQDVPAAAVLEVCPAGETLAGELGARLAADAGVALIIDYGHPHTAPGETLQAVRAHRYADPLAEPGCADLTHHVDFARLQRAAAAAGARCWGPVPQGLFLGRLGAVQRAEALAAAAGDAGSSRDILAAVRRLLHPRSMGALFQVLAISGDEHPPEGFVSPIIGRARTGD